LPCLRVHRACRGRGVEETVKQVVREWDEASLKTAYQRYREFFIYVEKAKGNPSIEDMLEDYAPGRKEDQMELLVMYEVTQISHRNALALRAIRRVRLMEGGGVEVSS